ncbi:hypothetical protein, partial [Xanthomonas vesicatoria]
MLDPHRPKRARIVTQTAGSAAAIGRVQCACCNAPAQASLTPPTQDANGNGAHPNNTPSNNLRAVLTTAARTTAPCASH